MMKCTFSNELGYPVLILDTDGFGLNPYILVNPSVEYEWGSEYYPVAYSLVQVDLHDVVVKLKREEITQTGETFETVQALRKALDNVNLNMDLPSGVVRMFAHKEADRPVVLNEYQKWMARQGIFKDGKYAEYLSSLVREQVPLPNDPNLETALSEAARNSTALTDFQRSFEKLQRYVLIEHIPVKTAVAKVEAEHGPFPNEFLVGLQEKGVYK